VPNDQHGGDIMWSKTHKFGNVQCIVIL
jgi:hypothetical protein